MIGHPLSVDEILKEIQRGQVKLPEIQRDYVWHGPQVSKLLDSLYHKYPVGQILLWDTTILPTTKNIKGSEEANLPSVGNPKIVLDGQQRLTSLLLSLGSVTDDDEVNVWFNLENEQFQRFQRRMKNDPLWVSVRDVVIGNADELDIMDRIGSSGGPDVRSEKGKLYRDRLKALRAVMDYKFPIEIFTCDDYEEVTELFVRINSQGKRLQMAELALAQLALRLPGVLVEKFEAAIEEYDELGFELDTKFLIRAFIAIGTNQSRFKYLTEFWKKSPKELEGIWNQTHQGIDSSINFVQHNAYFESVDWLPTMAAMIPLTVFFVKYRDDKMSTETTLLRWFYLASLRGRYSGSGEAAMDEDIKAVLTDKPLDALLQNLKAMGKTLEVSGEEFDDAGDRNPLFPMTYAAARKQKAKDWFTGHQLADRVAGQDQKIQVHHIFPKDILKKAKVRRRDINEIANLAFLGGRPNRKISNSPPESYLPEIADKYPERLEAQCIPMDRNLWKLDKFQDFLNARRQLLAKVVNDLIS